MTVPIRILLAEDSDDDAALVIQALRRAGYEPTTTRVDDRDSYLAALDGEAESLDAIISDDSIPQLSCATALLLMKARGLDLPFIVVSATIDEETTVGLLRAGAHDFVTKQKLARLGPALERELVEARNRAERRNAERSAAEALRLSDDQLRQAQKMEAVGQLAGGVAHDFNNLLTAILGYTALLLDSARDQPDLAADLQQIQKAGERAGSLTQQLLTFSRKQVLHPTILNLNEVVSELEKMLRRVVGEDVTLETIKASSLSHVKADPNRIEQILMTLAVNARDAMPRGGTLRIETKNETMRVDPRQPMAATSTWPCVTMIISDTGTGIPPEIIDRVFEPFFTTKGTGKGTGLGLSTVYGIVTQSGGVITVESQRNQGTSFSIRFPVVDVPADSVAPTAQLASHAGTETILLVEDEPEVRHLVQRVLSGRGYDVLEARDVAHAAAISTNHSGRIHLLLSDIVMPGLNGPDLAQRVVAQRPDVRVLYMSGFANRLSTEFGALGSGVTILHKPFTPESLVRTVRDCLDEDVQFRKASRSTEHAPWHSEEAAS